MSSIPKSFQAILWSQSVETLDLKRDRAYIIHHVLSYGDLDQLKWLKRQYSLDELQEVFLHHPINEYHPASLQFVQKYILGLTTQSIDENRYLKTSPRDIRF